MTHTSAGFTGSIDQVGEAKRFARVGPRFTVDTAADWKLELTTADRTVRVKTGTGQACGVSDTTNTDELIQFPANTGSTDRYDLLVNQWRWTTPVTQPAFAVLPGIDGAAGPDLTKLVRTPGTRYDGVLGVLRVRPGVGAFSANDLFSLAPTGGNGGPLIVPSPAFLSAVDGVLGAELIVASTGLRYRHNGAAWAAPSAEPRGSLCRPFGLAGAVGVGGGALPLATSPTIFVPAGRAIDLVADFQLYIPTGAGQTVSVWFERWQGNSFIAMGGIDKRVTDTDLYDFHLDAEDTITAEGNYFWKVAGTMSGAAAANVDGSAVVGGIGRASTMRIRDAGAA